MRKATLLLCGALAMTVSACSLLKNKSDDTTKWSAQRYYSEAEDAMKRKDYEEAIKHFEALEARYPYGRYAEQAQIETAYAYYKSGEPQSAVDAADRFIRLHPTHPNVDYAYYLKGLSHFSTKRTLIERLGGEMDLSDRDPQAARQGFESFSELTARFPNSRYAADARARMLYLLNALARHDVRVARFYLAQAAYVATVNRCKHVIETYQRAPAVEDALGVMAYAYSRMGLPKLSEDTLRVLKTNFPSSGYLQNLERAALQGTPKKPGFMSRIARFGGDELDVPPPGSTGTASGGAQHTAGRAAKQSGMLKRLWPFGKKDPAVRAQPPAPTAAPAPAPATTPTPVPEADSRGSLGPPDPAPGDSPESTPPAEKEKKSLLKRLWPFGK
ncbi:MAG: outer membrane protein assembly factor BamD [Gammaproteobacteria bacterium]|nr:outer membrane protein assembly factor BamD [Gammaproteobacteria bacterium]